MSRRSDTTTKIFVGSLPSNVTTDDLRRLFAPYGCIAECDIANRCGFLHLNDKELALKAIDDLNDTHFMGGRITVERGRSKSTNLNAGGGDSTINKSGTNADLINDDGTGRGRTNRGGSFRTYHHRPSPYSVVVRPEVCFDSRNSRNVETNSRNIDRNSHILFDSNDKRIPSLLEKNYVTYEERNIGSNQFNERNGFGDFDDRVSYQQPRSTYDKQRLPYDEHRLSYDEQRLPYDEHRLFNDERRLPYEERLSYADKRLSYEERRLPYEEQRLPYDERRFPYEERRLPYEDLRVPPPRHGDYVDGSFNRTNEPRPLMAINDCFDNRRTVAPRPLMSMPQQTPFNPIVESRAGVGRDSINYVSHTNNNANNTNRRNWPNERGNFIDTDSDRSRDRLPPPLITEPPTSLDNKTHSFNTDRWKKMSSEVPTNSDRYYTQQRTTSYSTGSDGNGGGAGTSTRRNYAPSRRY